MAKKSSIKELLYIDDLWDVESIDGRINSLRALISYGSNYMYDADAMIQILEKRKKRLLQ